MLRQRGPTQLSAYWPYALGPGSGRDQAAPASGAATAAAAPAAAETAPAAAAPDSAPEEQSTGATTGESGPAE